MSAADCIAAIRGETDLSDDEILEIAEAVLKKRKALIADGSVDRLDQRIAEMAAAEGERARLAAALARKHAALNIIARDRLDAQVDGLVASGLGHRDAIRAVLIGTTRGLKEGRVSVAARRLGYEARYLGEMRAEIVRDRPHIEKMLHDEALQADTVREIYELRPDSQGGGKPGSTGNDDARFLADLFTRHSERSRTDLNRLGANIGRLAGWAPQSHSAAKVRKVTAEAWADAVLPRLDLDRSFPDIDGDEAQIRAVLEDIYTSIVTGRDDRLTAREKGEHVGPANLAKSLGKHRVLHFRSADDWLAYARTFGEPNVVSAMWAHQSRAARLAAQMDALGPNPDVMIASLVDAQQRKVRNSAMDPVAKQREIQRLRLSEFSQLGIALAEVRGLTLVPENASMANIGSGIRAFQSMAKLGGAVLSAVFPDVVIAAANLRFQGMPLFAAYRRLLSEMLQGRGKGEAREIAFLVGEGFDGLRGHIISPYIAEDSAPGAISKALVGFFKWSGLSGQADVMRAAVGRILAANAGMHAGVAHADLPAAFAHVLGLHGIDAARWEAIRKAAWKGESGTLYLTADRVAGLSDETVSGLISGEIAAARRQASLRGRKTGSAPRADLTEAQAAWFNGWKAKRIARERADLEIRTAAFLADEVSFSHIESDEASRAVSLQGTRPGTAVGEAARFIMQFKGFPIAFSQRILGRTIHGGEGARSAGAAHIGHLIAGLTIAGYMSMSAKDIARGYEPRQPETPGQWAKVIFAAMVQGGGGGIYGDFLFGEANRFGGGVLGTAAGPTIGTVAQGIEMWQRAKEGDVRAADFLRLTLSNAPGANLFYLRPALDGLFLSALHESVSPGYLRRQARRREQDYGQERLYPADWGAMP